MEVCTAYFNDGSKYVFNIETREDLTGQALEAHAKERAVMDTLNPSGIKQLNVVSLQLTKERRYTARFVADERRRV